MRTVGNGEKGITPGRKSRDGRFRLPLVKLKMALPPVENRRCTGDDAEFSITDGRIEKRRPRRDVTPKS